MPINNIELIALDIDGTLLNSRGHLSPYTEEVIRLALQKDIYIVLCTGRPLPFCNHLAQQLNLTSYIITNNGAEIWRNEREVIERHFMDPVSIQRLWEFGSERELLMWMVSPYKLFRHSARPDSFTAYEWLKFGYGKLDDMMTYTLRENLAQYTDLEITSSSHTNIEINKRGVNKAVAIKKVCDELGISINNVMGVGDNLNDSQMIKDVGFGVAVDNADDILKEKAKYITDSNDSDGVAKVIKKFILS